MLVQFSIANVGGNEIVRYELSQFSKVVLDMDLVSNFLQAMQMFSENMGASVKEIVFSNIFLYIQTYGDFTIRIMLDEKSSIPLDSIFNDLSIVTYQILSTQQDIEVIKKEVVEEKYVPILKKLIEPDSVDAESGIVQVPLQPERPRIAIVGLEKAGKTSVKKAFFEKWSKEMIQKIRPTLGVETLKKKLDFIGQQFMIMDFGGQLSFRNQYLQNEMKWKGISILIFLIDIQREEVFAEAAEYLKNVWELAKKANKKPPRLSIFFHKFDPDKYPQLINTMGKCMMNLTDMLPHAVIYTTSIENDSCISALIKTIYFSSPEIVIRKLFDEIILSNFEEDILNTFLKTDTDWKDSNIENLSEKLNSVQSITKQMGKEYGAKLQEIWFGYFMGEWEPKQQQLKWNILEIDKTKQELFIKIRVWVDGETPYRNLILNIFDGLLSGIATTLQMASPKRIEDENFFGMWKLVF